MLFIIIIISHCLIYSDAYLSVMNLYIYLLIFRRNQDDIRESLCNADDELESNSSVCSSSVSSVFISAKSSLSTTLNSVKKRSNKRSLTKLSTKKSESDTSTVTETESQDDGSIISKSYSSSSSQKSSSSNDVAELAGAKITRNRKSHSGRRSLRISLQRLSLGTVRKYNESSSGRITRSSLSSDSSTSFKGRTPRSSAKKNKDRSQSSGRPTKRTPKPHQEALNERQVSKRGTRTSVDSR